MPKAFSVLLSNSMCTLIATTLQLCNWLRGPSHEKSQPVLNVARPGYFRLILFWFAFTWKLRTSWDEIRIRSHDRILLLAQLFFNTPRGEKYSLLLEIQWEFQSVLKSHVKAIVLYTVNRVETQLLLKSARAEISHVKGLKDHSFYLI